MFGYSFNFLLLSQVLDRGEKIELLVDKTENLQFQASTTLVRSFCDLRVT